MYVWYRHNYNPMVHLSIILFGTIHYLLYYILFFLLQHEQIAVEYRILAKKYHPDKVQEDEKIAGEGDIL